MEKQGRYYEYWGLKKPPFDNVPDQEMYFDRHRSMKNAVTETLCAIEDGDECLAVIIGDEGLGKTMTLRVIFDSLAKEKHRLAYVNNSNRSFMQLLKEIVSQLSGESCTESRRKQILEVFNQLLLKTRAAGKKVLIFMDEANEMKPSTLKALGCLTNMQGGDKTLFTIVLAGQLELAQRLEHPKYTNLFQRIGVYCHLTKIESQDLMREYIEHRLMRAGTSRRIFTDDAYEAIWEYAEHGVPRLINKVAKLALKAARTQALEVINANVVRQIGSRCDRVSKAVLPDRRERVCHVSSVVRETPRAPVVSVSPTDQLVSRPESPGNLDATLASVVVATDQQPTQSLMADIITFPELVYLKAKEMSSEQRLKLAGQLAAEVLRRHPHLIQQLGSTHDPVPAWTILRNIVMRRLEQRLANEPAPPVKRPI
jgi:general secretion pathway protein A